MQKEIRCRFKIQYLLAIIIASVSFEYKLISDYFDPTKAHYVNPYIWPIISIAIFLLTMFAVWLFTRTAIIINHNGIESAGTGFVPWSDIIKLDIIDSDGTIIIGVITNDPKKIENRQARLFKLFEKSNNLPKRDFYLYLGNVNKKPEEVINTIKLYKEIEGSPQITQ